MRNTLLRLEPYSFSGNSRSANGMVPPSKRSVGGTFARAVVRGHPLGRPTPVPESKYGEVAKGRFIIVEQLYQRPEESPNEIQAEDGGHRGRTFEDILGGCLG